MLVEAQPMMEAKRVAMCKACSLLHGGTPPRKKRSGSFRRRLGRTRYGGLNWNRRIETGAETENILRADVDAASAVGAVGVQDHRRRAVDRLERRPDHLRLGADGEAVHAVVAGGSRAGSCTRSTADLADQAVEGADRAEMAAPAVTHDEQVEQEHRRASPSRRAPMPKIRPRCSIDTGLTSSQAIVPVQRPSDQRHAENPVARGCATGARRPSCRGARAASRRRR